MAKWVTDIEMKDGKIVPMQIDNYNMVKKGIAKTYELKALDAVQNQSFGLLSWGGLREDGQKQNEYDGSQLDKACEEFYENMAEEEKAQVAEVEMDKNNNYKIVNVLLPESKKTKENENLEFAHKKNADTEFGG